jgi:SHS2 domain-containing protein
VALSRPATFHLLEHTADIGLEAVAPTRAELFATMGAGFKALLYGASPAAERHRHEVRVAAGDCAELLVAWLNEILYLCEREDLVPARFEVTALSDTELVAAIHGEVYDPKRHVVERTAKAVTYHRLLVEERRDGWYARVYIDL